MASIPILADRLSGKMGEAVATSAAAGDGSLLGRLAASNGHLSSVGQDTATR